MNRLNQLIISLVVFFSVNDVWAGRSARRAVEACKVEACNGGDGESGWLMRIIMIPVAIIMLAVFLDAVIGPFKKNDRK